MNSFECHNCKGTIEDDTHLIHGACYKCPHCDVFTVYNGITVLQSLLQEVLDYHNGIGTYCVSHESDGGETIGELWRDLEKRIEEVLAMGQNVPSED